jgi:hypothetical protein
MQGFNCLKCATSPTAWAAFSGRTDQVLPAASAICASATSLVVLVIKGSGLLKLIKGSGLLK